MTVPRSREAASAEGVVRVLHVTPYFAPAFRYGGPPRSVLGLCRGLRHADVHVEVFSTTANGVSDLVPSGPAGDQYEGVPVRYFSRTFPRRFFGAAGLASALAVAAPKFDVFHLHGLWNVPVWHAARQARRHRVPYVLSPRGMLEPGALALRRIRKGAAYAIIERRNLARAALLHATSALEARRLAERQFGVEIITLPNGIDLPDELPATRASFRRRLSLADQPVIVFLGRIHPIKRLDLLAAAFARVRTLWPDAHLIVAGPDEADHRRRVAPLFAAAGDHVHWTAEVDQEQKWSLLADANALVLCSSSENFGTSAAEAMAAGVPVVVTRTCPWEDVETHGCGFWVPAEAEAIAGGLVRILEDPVAAREMGARGRALMRAKYSWTAIARAMADRYHEVIARRTSPAEW